MQKTFQADKKTYNAPVIAQIPLTELAPPPNQVHAICSARIKKEGLARKRALGVFLFILAIALAIGAIALIQYLPGIRMGNYEITFIPYILFVPAIGALAAGIACFGRKTAANPEAAFKKLWGEALCTAPDYVMDAAPTFREHLFNLPDVAKKRLEQSYPFENPNVPMDNIVWFMGNTKNLVMSCFENYGTPLDTPAHYAVTYDKKPGVSLQPNGLALVQGRINIFRCPAGNKDATECVELVVGCYFARAGSYWVAVNTVPYFSQLLTQGQR